MIYLKLETPVQIVITIRSLDVIEGELGLFCIESRDM